MRKPTFDTLDAKPLIAPSRAAQLLAEAKARKPWPPETPCYKCGGPVGEPFAPWPASKPVCPVCALANIEAVLFAPDDSRCAHSSPACDPCVEADTIAAHST